MPQQDLPPGTSPFMSGGMLTARPMATPMPSPSPIPSPTPAASMLDRVIGLFHRPTLQQSPSPAAVYLGRSAELEDQLDQLQRKSSGGR